MKKHNLKWGILGTANIAQKALIPAIKASRHNELHAVASRSLTKAQEFAQLNAIPNAYGSYEELLQDAAIQAVYIPLPNDQHKHWTIEAMKAGKHVLCEKPIGLNEQEAREMVAMAEEKQVVLMEGFMYRYHPRFARLLKLVEDGTLGNLRFIHTAFTYNITNPNDIRLVLEFGGGALMDVGCYCIDISRQFTGREPISVQAQYYEGNTGIDLQMAATLDFGDNIYAQFEVSFNAFSRQLCHIAGNQGSLDIINPFISLRKSTKAILTTAEATKTIRFWRKDEYKLMVDHFNRVVSGKDQPRFPISNAIANMKVIDALVRSAHAQGALIHLDTLPVTTPAVETLISEPVMEEVKEVAEPVIEEVKEMDSSEPGKEPVD